MKPIRLTLEQKQPAAQVLARAFQDDPMMSFIAPEAVQRQRFVSWLMGTMTTYSLLYGEVYADPDLKGVVCWLPPGRTDLTLWRVFRTGMAALGFKLDAVATRRFWVNMRYTTQLHKQAVSENHWYLWAIGVEPGCQGQGIGGSLITPVLERANYNSVCCYLETHNAKNPPFYRKFGFEVISDAEIPKYGLRVWGMLRKP